MIRKTVAENSEIAELHNGVRPYETKDASAVKMLVGQGVMEGLARANKQSGSSWFTNQCPADFFSLYAPAFHRDLARSVFDS